jgi:predicted DNA-binding transcriptional regulator AlpA
MVQKHENQLDPFATFVGTIVDEVERRANLKSSQASKPLDEKLSKMTHKVKSLEYITAKQVCQLISISHSTLWRWSNKGFITKVCFNGIPRYSKSEVLSLSVALEPKFK